MSTKNIKAKLVPKSLWRPAVLSDLSKLPAFWATVYEITTMAGLSDKTAHSKLTAINKLYHHAIELFDEDVLDSILGNQQHDKLEFLLDSFFNALRNEALQSGTNNTPTWKEALKFAIKISSEIEASNTSSAVSAISTRIAVRVMRYENLLPNPVPSSVRVPRAVPSFVLAELYQLFDPMNEKNPFRTETQRWRNYCLFLILLHQGLRRGEALLLGVDAVKIGRDTNSLKSFLWINVENKFEVQDPRTCDPPSIKNAQSHRQIPISQELASILEHFTANFRGKSPFPHLFLNNRGDPLGSRGVSEVMLRASSALSAESKNILQDRMKTSTVSAHDLRHTCATMRLAHCREIGVDEEDALQRLRAFFGWSYASSMPRLYAAAHWEYSLEATWERTFDVHVDLLRRNEFG